MGVDKKIISTGNGTDVPKVGDEVTIEYTGNLYDESKGAAADFRGKQYVIYTRSQLKSKSVAKLQSSVTRFDSSKGRGPFKTQIGVGKVIKGWDEGVTTMSLGEKAILTISSDYAYGER
ncbi:hypothetical protein ACLMJK_004995 [Lecanora helva]